VSVGPFAKKLMINNEQVHTDKWKKFIESEISKPVNLSSHYRIAIIKNGKLPQDCGSNEWVCGWAIDKLSGEVISELPKFNGNTKYFSTIDNGTPSPDLFDAEYYPNSSMIWGSGQNIPEENKYGEARCANAAYNFKSNIFSILTFSRCEIDIGSDESADSYLP